MINMINMIDKLYNINFDKLNKNESLNLINDIIKLSNRDIYHCINVVLFQANLNSKERNIFCKLFFENEKIKIFFENLKKISYSLLDIDDQGYCDKCEQNEIKNGKNRYNIYCDYNCPYSDFHINY